jgi:hypothetical protein
MPRTLQEPRHTQTTVQITMLAPSDPHTRKPADHANLQISPFCSSPWTNTTVTRPASDYAVYALSHFRSVKCVLDSEICRLLKPGGVAYWGGGMGNAEVKSQVMESFSTNEVLKGEKEAWEAVAQISHKVSPERLQDELRQASVVGTVEQENGGLWVQIFKDRNGTKARALLKSSEPGSTERPQDRILQATP